MTYWGRYRKEQSFVAYPAKQHDVYKSRMEDKYFALIQKPVGAGLQEELATETIAEKTKKTSSGFWNSLLGAFASKKEVTTEQKPRWPAKK